MAEIDLYADENAPLIQFYSSIYRVTIPRPAEFPTGEIPFVYVEVDNFGMISVDQRQTYWSGTRLRTLDIVDDNRAVNSLLVEIHNWLVEWELAEWKAIGPEDSELFATEKLLTAKRMLP